MHWLPGSSYIRRFEMAPHRWTSSTNCATTGRLFFVIVLVSYLVYISDGLTSAWTTSEDEIQSVSDFTEPVVSGDRSRRSVNRSEPVMDRLTSRQRRNVKREILAVLGLDHPPRPAMRGARDIAVAHYMMSLYKTVVEVSGNDVIQPDLVGDQPSQMEKIQLDSADTIISFTDYSK